MKLYKCGTTKGKGMESHFSKEVLYHLATLYYDDSRRFKKKDSVYDSFTSSFIRFRDVNFPRSKDLQGNEILWSKLHENYYIHSYFLEPRILMNL